MSGSSSEKERHKQAIVSCWEHAIEGPDDKRHRRSIGAAAVHRSDRLTSRTRGKLKVNLPDVSRAPSIRQRASSDPSPHVNASPLLIHRGQKQIFKPISNTGRRGTSELSFYSDMFPTKETLDPLSEEDASAEEEDFGLLALRPFLCVYFGTEDVEIGDGDEWRNQLYLVLEDIYAPFSKPCVLDVKVGPITYDHDASETVKRREERKSSGQGELGFRLLSMNVAGTSVTKPIHHDTKFFATLSAEQVEGFVVGFLSAADAKPGRKRAVLRDFLAKLRQLQKAMEQQCTYIIRSSSLVFIYEGDENVTTWDDVASPILVTDTEAEKGGCCRACNCLKSSGDTSAASRMEKLVNTQTTPGGEKRMEQRPLADMRLMEFTHVSHSDNKERDENFITGVGSLISLLSKVENELNISN